MAPAEVDARGDAWWSRPAADLMAELGTGPTGLAAAEARQRLRRDGPNAPRVRARITTLGLAINQVKSPLVLVLVGAAAVSAAVQEWVDALIIACIVAASTVLGFWQEHAASNAVAELRARLRLTARVRRGGDMATVPVEDIVVGDVVELSAGSIVPADGVVVDARDLHVNQAILTGETFPVAKAAGIAAADAPLAGRTNALFAGTNVRSGTATLLVVRTGRGTAYGEIAERLAAQAPETQFERGIRQFGYLLTHVMFWMVLAVFALNVIDRKPPVDALLFAIALAVGMTPELLPAIISVNLAKGARAMAGRGVIVRRLNAIEDFGSMDVLCTDKTGTLTEGVVRLDGALDAEGRPSAAVLRAGWLNARFQTGLANPLDEAILTAAGPAEGGTAGATARGVEKLDEIPYDFVRKRLSVVVRDGDAAPSMVTKGALEPLLAACASVGDGRHPPQALDPEARAAILARFRAWSAQGYRVLGVATRPVDPAGRRLGRDDETDLEFRGFLRFFDPPKPDAGATVAALARLGVTLKIVTGDHHAVAEHVAREVGLPVAGVLTGAQVTALSDEALVHLADRTSLFAEVDPNQKERIILALRKSGHVVGYMGDGINDAPALHAADAGISVDGAVDVAREAADFVLLSRDLGVLRDGIAQGRRTFANSIKYVFTTTSANFGNMFSMAAASAFLPFLPLLATQVLLNNFLSDFPALTIAGDNVDPEMVAAPRRWDLAFIQRFMVLFGLVSAAFDFVTFGVLLWVFRAGPATFRTGWFLESLLTELAIALVVRTRRPFLRSRPSRWLVASTAVVALAAVALPYVPAAGRAFGFVPLPPALLATVIGITGLYVAVSEATKHAFYRWAVAAKG